MYSIGYSIVNPIWVQKHAQSDAQSSERCCSVSTQSGILAGMSTTQSFAARLRELRAAAGITQHELADRSGLHRQAIAKLELAEREPSWASVLALAKALGVSIAAFEPSVEAFTIAPTEEASPRARGRPRKEEEAAPGKGSGKKPRKRKGG